MPQDLPLTLQALVDAQLPVSRAYECDAGEVCIEWRHDPAKWQKRSAEHIVYTNVEIRHTTPRMLEA